MEEIYLKPFQVLAAAVDCAFIQCEKFNNVMY